MSLRIARPVLLNQVMSPYGIATISTLIFLLAWVFPPGLYTDLIDEPDLMFFNAETLLFFLTCVAGFWAGLLLIDFLFPSPALLDTPPRTPQLKGFFLLLPLILTTVTAVFVGIELFNNAPDILTLLLTQQGDVVKLQQNQDLISGPVGWGSIMQIGVLWWTYWMLTNSRPSHPRRLRDRRYISWLVFAVGLIVQTALSVLKVSRADLMPVFAGIAVLYIIGKIRRKELSVAGLVRALLLFSFAVMILFYLFGVLRGNDDPASGFATFIGYTLAAYNRLAAVVGGTMHYPYGGHGVYLSEFLVYNHSINALVPLKSTLGWPDFLELWYSEFQAPQLAGLRNDLIWSGVFGYLFSDFGWATPLVLLGYGTVYGFVWRSAKLGKTFGLTLYPWLAFTALCWFSSNMVFDSKFPFLMGAGVILTIYEKIFSLRIFAVRPESQLKNV